MKPTSKEKIVEINAKYHNMLAPIYDSFQEQKHPKIIDLYASLMRQVLKEFHDRGKQTLDILDMGCGTGYMEQFLQPQSNHITGIDVSRGMIEQAKKKFPQVTYKLQDIYSFSSSRKFDLIVENSVLHHLKDYEDCLRICKTLLKPGGVFFMGAEPNYYCYHYLAGFKYLVRRVIPDHRRLKTNDVKEQIEPYAEYHMYFSDGFNPFEFKKKLSALGFSDVTLMFSSREFFGGLLDRTGLRLIDFLPNWVMDHSGIVSRQFYVVAKV